MARLEMFFAVLAPARQKESNLRPWLYGPGAYWPRCHRANPTAKCRGTNTDASRREGNPCKRVERPQPIPPCACSINRGLPDQQPAPPPSLGLHGGVGAAVDTPRSRRNLALYARSSATDPLNWSSSMSAVPGIPETVALFVNCQNVHRCHPLTLAGTCAPQ